MNEVGLEEKCRTFLENNVASKILILETLRNLACEEVSKSVLKSGRK